MSDMEKWTGSAVGSNTQISDPQGTINSVVTDYLAIPLTDGGTAATAVAEHVVHTVIHRCKLGQGPAPGQTGTTPILEGPKFVSGVAVVADNTNNAAVLIARRRAGAATAVATYTSNVAGGSTTLWIPKDVPIVGDFQFEIGDVITVAVTKAGSGVAIASSTVGARLTIPLEKN
jgi:hypothetical protein